MTQWIERKASKSHECARCKDFIPRGDTYYQREGGGGHSCYCLACGVKISEPVARPESIMRKRARRVGEPLLGLGHVVHGLGRMGA